MSSLLHFLKNFFRIRRNKTIVFDQIIVAEVVKIIKHPNADRLRLVSLNIGNRVVEPVVCGAFNFTVGNKVALALPGATIPQDAHAKASQPFVLAKAKIRGVESQGMICSAFELGIGPFSDAQKIMILKDNLKPGTPFRPEMQAT
jgi:phenylalanyl-tRNA synthetase beta chain